MAGFFQIKQQNLIFLAKLSVFVVCSLGFVRHVVVFPYFIKYGTSYNSAKAELERLIGSGESVGVTSGFFSLAETTNQVRIFQAKPKETYRPAGQ
jgi:hypothetical protein